MYLTDGILVISFQPTAVQPRKTGSFLVNSVGLLSQNDSDRFDHDFQVQPEGPIANIAVVQFDPGTHFFDRIGLKAAS
jgi:hypothetical protein